MKLERCGVSTQQIAGKSGAYVSGLHSGMAEIKQTRSLRAVSPCDLLHNRISDRDCKVSLNFLGGQGSIERCAAVLQPGIMYCESQIWI